MAIIITSKGHRFDRNMPQPLPPHRMLTRRTFSGNPMVDLRSWMGPLKNQAAEGSCTGHAGTSSGEWIFRKYFKKQPIFSPQYTYAKELILEGVFPQDDGGDGIVLCNTMIVNGCCEESLYPYVAGQILMPTAAQDANAALWRMGAYHGVPDSETALSVLGDPTPWPLMVGFDVPASFESDEMAETGIMQPMQAGETPIGGHETAATCGFDVGATPTLRPANCPPALLIQNSWGTGWGWDGSGLFWMPLAVLDDPTTDIKIAHTGHPWALPQAA